ncbi:MAG: hypothetical protein WA777_18465 [Rhodanobacter sp.]
MTDTFLVKIADGREVELKETYIGTAPDGNVFRYECEVDGKKVTNGFHCGTSLSRKGEDYMRRISRKKVTEWFARLERQPDGTYDVSEHHS